MKLLTILIRSTSLFMLMALSGFAESAGVTEIALIGKERGTLSRISVSDCGALDAAFEITSTAPSLANTVGIDIPVAQFDLVGGAVYVLSFYTRVSDVFDTLKVSLTDVSGRELSGFTYQLSGQWTQICFPFIANGNEKIIRMTVGGKAQKVYVGGIVITQSDSTLEEAKSGYFMVEADDWESVNIDWNEGLGIGNCMDVVVNGDYIYALADKKLHVFKAGRHGARPTLVTSTKPYGDLRQMSLSDDKKSLIVTARVNGVFAFDISDPEKPLLASRLDSLEMATGVDVQGKYCYIADRVFGVSIFDISDIYHPVIVSNVRVQGGDEAQDCKVYNGYLYVGGWGYCRVSIWDVRDPGNPKAVGRIDLQGRGDGVNIKDNILYAATGHMEHSSLRRTSPGYGLGNGMEIYDIADPYNPVLLSRVRTEGRLYSAWPDIWRVKVAGKYAYLTSTYNGMYVYDMTDKKLPKRVAHINVVAKKDEPGYLDLRRTNDWVYPFDTTQERRGTLLGCDILDGTAYIANQSGDLYMLSGKDYFAGSMDQNDSTLLPQAEYSRGYFENDFEAMGFKDAKVFKPGSQVWASARYGDYTYVAAGLGGIYIIDDAMDVIAQYPSGDITNDIRIYGNRIYTAENGAGICIYEIDTDNPAIITQVGSYREAGSPIIELALSPDARYALAQRGNTSLLLDLSDVRNPKRYQNFWYTMVYQNQISRECINDRYLMVFANGSKTVVIDFGENGSYEVPVINESWTSGITQEYGIAADGDRLLATAGRRLFRFDLSDANVYTSSLARNESVDVFAAEGIVGGGVPAIVGDYLFVTKKSSGDLMLMELPAERNAAPRLLRKVNLRGSPARLMSAGGRVYLPLGYGGLVSFQLTDLQTDAGD